VSWSTVPSEPSARTAGKKYGTSMKEKPASTFRARAVPARARSGAPRVHRVRTTRDEAIANARRAFRAYLELLTPRVSIEHWKDLDPNTFQVLTASGSRRARRHRGWRSTSSATSCISSSLARALLSLVREISRRRSSGKPTETMWSVREALEHVMLTEASLLSRLEKCRPTRTTPYRRPSHGVPTIHGDGARDTELDHLSWVGADDSQGHAAILEHEFEHLGHSRDRRRVGASRPPSIFAFGRPVSEAPSMQLAAIATPVS